VRDHHLLQVTRALSGLLCTLLACAAARAATPETVAFESAGRTLHGLLWRPAGGGRFPALLYNHGSAPGLLSNEAFELLAPVFVAQGWVFFAPYRRGQGLSSDAGPYIGDQIVAARARGGHEAAESQLIHLLSTEQLQDQLAALAWLRRQPFVRAAHIAVMGNSFGGIEALLGAAQGGYCAAIDAAGGAESWDVAPHLRAMMLHAARQAQAPLLLLQAQNDYSVQPSVTLYAALRAAGKPGELLVFAPYGVSAEEGHGFAYRGVQLWQDAVLGFLRRNCLR
jgi:carboxymethylenebutenolidase